MIQVKVLIDDLNDILCLDIRTLIDFLDQKQPVQRVLEECVGYCTSAQALADYAAIIAELRQRAPKRAPVVAFGGSYGGMLSGWMRNTTSNSGW